MATTTITHHELEQNDCWLHYWLAGPSRRPLVVFTHGLTMDHRMFEAQVEAVAQQYRVLIWDVRGHGQSQPLGDGFSVRGVVEDLIVLLNLLGYEQATLVGHSMGGYVSQELLFLYPERVTALVTIGCTCLTLKHPKIIELGLRMSPLALALYPYHFFKWQAAWGITVTPKVRAYVYEGLVQLSKQQFVTMWSALVSCFHEEPDYQIKHPLLVTHGEHDHIGFGVMRQQALAWTARDPDSRYAVIPAAGHNAHQENPDFFNKKLHQFLNQQVRVD
jgi:3-oxoadipate enol-lactonase